MIRSILWKETREHLGTFLVLALCSAGLIVAGSALFSLDNQFTRIQLSATIGVLVLLLAMATSFLTGALLTGSDNEGKTRPWLDSLPGLAWQRWLVQIGFALVAQSIMVLLWVVSWLSMFLNDMDWRQYPPVLLLLVLILGMFSCLAWGQWGGYRSQSVFGGFGLGILGFCAAILIYFFCYVIMAIAYSNLRNYFPRIEFLFAEMGLLFFAGILGILVPLWHVASDHYRGSNQFSLSSLPLIRSLARWGWLFERTATWPIVGMIVVGVLAGIVLPHSFLVWPLWSLSVGVVGGLLVLGPDQDGEKSFNSSMRSFSPFQFDLRVLPAMVLSLGILLTPLVLPGLSTIIQNFLSGTNHEDQTRLAALTWPGVGFLFPLGSWFFLWWAAGFGSALWTSLFFDKWIVSLVVSLGLGALISTAWVPSFWGGHLSIWWLIGLVTLFWGISRFLYRRFSSSSIGERGLLAFAIMLVAVGGFTGIGLVSRFVFLPGTNPPFEEAKIAQLLTNPNPQIVDEVRRHLPVIQESNWLGNVPFLNFSSVLEKPVKEWSEKEKQYLEKEYPSLRPEFIENWKVPREIFSLFVALNGGNYAESSPNLTWIGNPSWELCQLRLIHSLFNADQGKPTDLPGELNRTLYISACLQHKGNTHYISYGTTLEQFAFSGMEHYLLYGKPDEKTLADIAKVLDEHAARLGTVELIPLEIGYFISLQSLKNLMAYTTGFIKGPLENQTPNERLYWQIYNFAMKAPWELERKRRTINDWFSSSPVRIPLESNRDQREFFSEIPYYYLRTGYTGSPEQNDILDRQKRNQTLLDLARVAVAAKRFQIANKVFPKTLVELSPKYLVKVPTDSFTGAEFRFRIAKAVKPDLEKVAPLDSAGAAGGTPGGEDLGLGGIGMPPGGPIDFQPDTLVIERNNKKVPLKEGTLVLWSVGPDGQDSGGFVDGQGLKRSPYSTIDKTDDLIFLIGP